MKRNGKKRTVPEKLNSKWTTAMVKPAEVKKAWRQGKFHASLMIYTAVMVVVTDFLVGVLSALLIYGVLFKFLDKASEGAGPPAEESAASRKAA